MAVNKVEVNGETMLDLTQDTVTPENLLSGATAHNAAGEQISGAVAPVSGDVFYVDLEGKHNDGTGQFEYTTTMTQDQLTKAYTSGKSLVCRLVANQIPITLPLFMAGDQTGAWVFSGAGAINVNANMQFNAQTFTVALINMGGSLAVVAQQTRLANWENLRAHAGDANIHVTSADKKTWNSKASKPTMTTVTLSATGWNSSTKKQTVTVSGVLADTSKQVIWVAFASEAALDAYMDAGIVPVAQAANAVTLRADTVPTADITVNIVVQEVGA